MHASMPVRACACVNEFTKVCVRVVLCYLRVNSQQHVHLCVHVCSTLTECACVMRICVCVRVMSCAHVRMRSCDCVYVSTCVGAGACVQLGMSWCVHVYVVSCHVMYACHTCMYEYACEDDSCIHMISGYLCDMYEGHDSYVSVHACSACESTVCVST
jgi:hypothetical protein